MVRLNLAIIVLHITISKKQYGNYKLGNETIKWKSSYYLLYFFLP